MHDLSSIRVRRNDRQPPCWAAYLFIGDWTKNLTLILGIQGIFTKSLLKSS
jgi:hypothetical protein